MINLEQERELKKRNQYVANLATKKKQAAGDSEDEGDPDDEEAEMDEQERENMVNEKLLKRLYKAAQDEIDQEQQEKQHEGPEQSAMEG